MSTLKQVEEENQKRKSFWQSYILPRMQRFWIKVKPAFNPIIDVIASLLRTFATALSIISLFTLLGMSLPLTLGLIGLVGTAYCFKEYAKARTAGDDPEVSNRKLTKLEYFWTGLAIFISILCAVGVESLFVATIVMTAITAPFSLGLTLIIASFVLAAITLPNDAFYYWNCLRKYFGIPEREHVANADGSFTKSDIRQFRYIILSNITSSILVFGGVVATFAGIGALFGPVGLLVGVVVGLVLGTIGAYANYLLLVQTYNELSREFKQLGQNSTFVQKLVAFNTRRAEVLTRKITTWCGAGTMTVPLIQSFLTSKLVRGGGFGSTIVLCVLTAVIATYSAWRVLNDFLKRVTVVKETSAEESAPLLEEQRAKGPVVVLRRNKKRTDRGGVNRDSAEAEASGTRRLCLHSPRPSRRAANDDGSVRVDTRASAVVAKKRIQV